MNTRNLQLYITAQTSCSYFDDRISSNLVPDPQVSLNMPIYNHLIQNGFRRSGSHCYRPHCETCQAKDQPDHQACVACRIAVEDFRISRSQKRCMKNNQDIEMRVADAGYTDEYFDLYRRYLNSRHADGSMADPAVEDFRQFLYCDWCDTRFLNFYQHDRLVAVAVTDIVSDGISAVYSFFEPRLVNRSLGTFCILSQLDFARSIQREYVYLGYWIDGHPKMSYKQNYRPLQVYLDNRWR